MQFSKIASLFALVASAAALSISDLPSCALLAAISSIDDTGCSLTDVSCICESSTWMASLVPAVEAACSAANVQKTITFAEEYCASAGVTLDHSSLEALVSSTSSKSRFRRRI